MLKGPVERLSLATCSLVLTSDRAWSSRRAGADPPVCLPPARVRPLGSHLLLCLSITVPENAVLSATFPRGLVLIT